MTKLIRVLDDYSEFKLNFSIGSHNVILFEDDRLKINLIKFFTFGKCLIIFAKSFFLQKWILLIKI